MQTPRDPVSTASPDPEKIQNLFSSIAGGYDRANDLITFGLARAWRKAVVAASGAKAGDHVLDCATGTGDLAIEFKKVVGANGKVIGTDFCADMLAYAPAKAVAQNLEVKFEQADAMNLPYADATFDVVSIAYGIRNVADPAKALREMARVCKPGGRVMVLETGDTQWPLMKHAMQFYFKKIVPRLGGWVTGQPQAYDYLNKSSLKFPSRERFVQLMNSTGCFHKISYRTLMGGASFIYRADI
ncbi:MAG: bifunctional demethylmenaquinone methyltransferase/2-methoxy-6-polyprenyl-1,4-benzoquinol methylase UbiE [Bdellovibrionales bacterium]